MATKTVEPATSATPVPAPESSREERFVAWLVANQKLLLTAVGIVVAVVAAVWLMSVSAARKERFAQAALEQAWAVGDQGNLAQAAADLQRVVTSFGGTRAALEARLSLNQTRILSGQAQLAADDLRTFIATNPPARIRASAQSMLGVALENAGQPAEAAAAYEAAAETAEMPGFKADALVSAARAHLAAGNRDQAISTLRNVVATYEGTIAHPMAEMRLGELLKGS